METPVGYKRVTPPVGGMARARLWGSLSAAGSSSSGSDRPADESCPELSDLVDSFYSEDVSDGDVGCAPGMLGRTGRSPPASARELLAGLVEACRRDTAASIILSEAEAAWRSIMEDGEAARWPKRRLMWWLRERGLDAGLCKLRECRETAGGSLALARHQYVDVLVGAEDGARYIVEPDLADEFSVARPTPQYQALLDALPAVFVGRPDALRELLAVMSAAAAESLKSSGMHVPPWRRREHVQEKWSGPYRRTTNLEPKGGGIKAVGSSLGRRDWRSSGYTRI